MHRLAVLFSGQGSNFAHILKHLHQKDVEIVVALTNNPNAEGIKIAHAYNIPLEIINSQEFQEREAFDRAVVKRLLAYNISLTVLAGFMRILTPHFTQHLTAINLHPSLLPKHKGLHAIKRSYEDSDTKGGVSIHYVNEELDGGEIILQKSISKGSLSFEEYDRAIRQLEKVALVEAIELLCKGK
jgi:phosphoribosylglycinamide formyltransferase-1